MINAAIDIGTNTVKLLIASVGPRRQIRTILERIVPARLGEDLHHRATLKPRAMARTITALRGFLNLCRRHRVASVSAVATAVLRDARNGRAFQRLCLRRLSLPVRILSGVEEARLACLGASSGMRGSSLLFIDIGGGSTEVILMKKRKIVCPRSLPLGAVSLSSRFLRSDPPHAQELLAMERKIGRLLRIPHASSSKIVAIGGTGATLVMLARSMRSYRPERIHGKSLRRMEIEDLLRWMTAMTIRQRAAMTGMEPGRADVILAGATILLEAMRMTDKRSVVISVRGVRYGILLAQSHKKIDPSPPFCYDAKS